ncbi:hypothetical protein BXZ70DRAFT_1005356 [Cristinia sonorae]|uniref:Uncharacterized protein n=1 Tax=Cristinia sonorae TaxID=1940300 RepID=A0A8K0UUS2_9AGAR|nr:hypothetical protein BXZ70DRAFT_1005356 [Cristinia sonorae]
MASTSTNPARAPELAEHQERLNELGWRIQSAILKYRELVNAHEDEDVRNDISWKFLNGLHREMDEVYFVLGWISGCTLGESAGQIPSSIQFLQQFSLWQSSMRGYSIAIKYLRLGNINAMEPLSENRGYVQEAEGFWWEWDLDDFGKPGWWCTPEDYTGDKFVRVPGIELKAMALNNRSILQRAKDILMRNAATLAFLDEVIDVNQAAAGGEREDDTETSGQEEDEGEDEKTDEEEDNRMVE